MACHDVEPAPSTAAQLHGRVRGGGEDDGEHRHLGGVHTGRAELGGSVRPDSRLVGDVGRGRGRDRHGRGVGRAGLDGAVGLGVAVRGVAGVLPRLPFEVGETGLRVRELRLRGLDGLGGLVELRLGGGQRGLGRLDRVRVSAAFAFASANAFSAVSYSLLAAS